MTTTISPRYQVAVGQACEVEQTDFSEAGFAAGLPKMWVKGIVAGVTFNGKLRDIKVESEDGRLLGVERIGPRGGNNKIRFA